MKSVPGNMFSELKDSSSFSASTSGGNSKPSAIISFFNCSSRCLISTLSYSLLRTIHTHIARTKSTPSLFLHFGLRSNSVHRHKQQLSRIHSRYETIQITTRNTNETTLTFANFQIHRLHSWELIREFVHERSHV